ncbi:MAG: M18 family aminopeptidase [Clostridia bacterium]|nr:M18 family aminopeptidase [Clostridia bacterium]
MDIYAKNLLDYLNAAHTQFQSTEYLAKMLKDAGGVKLDLRDAWSLEKGKLYYFVRSETSLAAFRIGSDPVKDGFRIGAAHQDSPGLRVKPSVSSIDGGYERVCVEPYGGLINHVWLDRPLSVAGALRVKDGDGAKTVLVDINKPFLIIPSAAVHIVRDVNTNAQFNPQTELLPIFTQLEPGAPKEKRFLKYIADAAGVSADDVLSFELCAYDAEPACFVGANDEFISSPRLDDSAMAYAAVAGVCDACKAGGDVSSVALVFDHEECGSNTDRGAHSNTLDMLTQRIFSALGLSAEDRFRSFDSSVVFSADMAHAVHPAYAGKYDPNMTARIGGGPVLKTTECQSYATSQLGSAYFKLLCEKNSIPYQVFFNRSDARGGGTIGPILSSRLGLVTVDIGNPMLSMHSIRELGGSSDAGNMEKLFSVFFNDKKGI